MRARTLAILGVVAWAAAGGAGVAHYSRPPGSASVTDYSRAGAGLSTSQLENLWTSNGGDPGAAANMAGIAIAESDGQADIVQSGQPPGLTGYGVWQITPTSGIRQHGQFGNLLNADNNAKAAVDLYKADGYAPWRSDAYVQAHGL